MGGRQLPAPVQPLRALRACLQYLCIAAGLAWTAASAVPTTKYDFCIIGAGPAGLQLGQLMLTAKRSYAIFERSADAGSFFAKYPIHRKLISINKRYTGRTDAEFNLRHDWNSLLDHDDVLPVPNRTHEYFPHADVVLQYLREFSRDQVRAGRIFFNTNVDQISRAPSSGGGSEGFVLQLGPARPATAAAAAANAREARCRAVVVATGLSKPTIPTADASPGLAELSVGYESLPPTGETFENKRVAVFGTGNAGFETANALAGYTSYVHVFNGHPTKEFPIFAWESRYVGNLRAVNAALIDAYMLKSLDGGFAEHSVAASSVLVRRCGEGRRFKCLFALDDVGGRRVVYVGSVATDGSDAEGAAFVAELGDSRVLPPAGSAHGGSPRLASMEKSDSALPQRTALPRRELWQFAINGANVEPVYVASDAISDDNVDAIMEFAKRQGGVYPLVYDEVVRCLGWQHDIQFYGEGAVPLLQGNRKFAVMDESYQAVGVPGLFYAGLLAHGKDFKRSAGGFIHGFRYTARALFSILEHKYHSQEWRNLQHFDVAAGAATAVRKNGGFADLLSHLFRRINTASGPYQMVSTLGDGIVLEPGKGGTGVRASYYEEVPAAYFNRRFAASPRILFVFGYNQQRRSLVNSIRKGTQFQVFLWYYPGGDGAVPEGMATRKEVLRLVETLHTDWNTTVFRDSVASWLSARLAMPASEWSASPMAADPAVNLAQKRSKPKKDWYPGEIDVWVTSTSQVAVELFCDGRSAAKLEPGGAKRVRGHELDIWSARAHGCKRGTNTEARWTLDVAHGIVQDVVVADIEESVCSPAAGGDKDCENACGLQVLYASGRANQHFNDFVINSTSSSTE